MTWPSLQPFLTNNFVRGAVTGLGLVNLIAGFADLAFMFLSRPDGDDSFPFGERAGRS
jgi:hypothetical protein